MPDVEPTDLALSTNTKGKICLIANESQCEPSACPSLRCMLN